jgi:hypothetical protein
MHSGNGACPGEHTSSDLANHLIGDEFLGLMHCHLCNRGAAHGPDDARSNGTSGAEDSGGFDVNAQEAGG